MLSIQAPAIFSNLFFNSYLVPIASRSVLVPWNLFPYLPCRRHRHSFPPEVDETGQPDPQRTHLDHQGREQSRIPNLKW